MRTQARTQAFVCTRVAVHGLLDMCNTPDHLRLCTDNATADDEPAHSGDKDRKGREESASKAEGTTRALKPQTGDVGPWPVVCLVVHHMAYIMRVQEHEV